MQRAGWWWWVRAGWAVGRRPSLWRVGVGQLRRLAPAGWWRSPPFLPLPEPAYLRFRLETQYGSAQAPDPADIVTYLHWCRTWRAQR